MPHRPFRAIAQAHRLRSVVLVPFLVLTVRAGSPGGEPPAAPSYPSTIRPMFEAHCLKCHGPKVRKAELDLSTYEAILKGEESSPAVVSGKAGRRVFPLYELVHEGKMPAGTKTKLAPEQMESLRLWIESGAKSGSEETVGSASVEVNQHDVYPILLRRCVVCHGRDVPMWRIGLGSAHAGLDAQGG